MEYLIRLVQLHETFRRPEIEALATLTGTDVEFVSYNLEVNEFFLRPDHINVLFWNQLSILSSMCRHWQCYVFLKNAKNLLSL